MIDKQEIFIIIPAKDEAPRIQKVIQRTIAQGYENIVVVDDGSRDDTGKVAKALGAIVLKHPINLGPGAATQTGFEYAIKRNAGIVVTMDADGQHFPEDIVGLIEAMERTNSDLVIGSRFLQRDNEIPFIRRCYNRVGNLITFFLTGVHVTDSQSGMKAIRSSAVRKMNIRLNGYAFCTEIIMLIKELKLTHSETPIKVLYSRETMEKGQSFLNGMKMIGSFFSKRFLNL